MKRLLIIAILPLFLSAAPADNFQVIKNQMIELTDIEIKISNDFKKCLDSSKNKEEITKCRENKRLAINKVINKDKKPYVRQKN